MKIVSLATTILLLGLPTGLLAAGEPLKQPLVVESDENGVLDVTITLEDATHATDDFTITSRLFNGTLPGPTLVVSPGDTFRIKFQNKLSGGRGIPHSNNQLSGPDESNLHWHGLYVTGELPSDDTSYVVEPGQEFQYETLIPDNHLGGTHWMHPHRHGSTTLQVAGGAAAAILVKDPPGFLPSQYEDAPSIILVCQQMLQEELLDAAEESGDPLTSFASNVGGNFISVNGQYQPEITLKANQWTRFRFIFAAYHEGQMTITTSSPQCEMQLIAKDGVYLRQVPRPITQAPITLGGRADIMMKCPQGGESSSSFALNANGNLLATLKMTTSEDDEDDETSGAQEEDDTTTSLETWIPDFPAYLQDVLEKPASEGCSCTTNFGDDAVNGIPFQPDSVLHTSYLGAVVERTIDAGNHPYHQHVYPYQLVEILVDEAGDDVYHQIGDWHDTWSGEGVIRYQPQSFATKIMVHCHRLDHEDEGMMSIERVYANEGAAVAAAACTCRNPSGLPVWAIVVIAVGASVVLVLAVVAVFCWSRRRRRSSGYEEGEEE